MAHKIINGIQVELTPAEVTAMEEQAVAWEAGAFDRAMADLRSNRNRLLAASDWTQLTDTTLTSSEKNKWMNYRTELRNLTNGITTVEQANNVAMPTIPNG